MWPFKKNEENKIEETKKQAVLHVFYDNSKSCHYSGIEDAEVFNSVVKWWGNESMGLFFVGKLPDGDMYFLRRDKIIRMWVNVE